MKQSYSEVYRHVAHQIETDAIQRLGRALTAEEARGIWEAGTLMMLEVVGQSVTTLPTAEAVATDLAVSGNAFQERRRLVLDTSYILLQELLGRLLREHERHTLEQARLDSVVEVVEVVRATRRFRQRAIFKSRLAQL